MTKKVTKTEQDFLAEFFLKIVEEILDELVIIAVRCGIAKAHVSNIHDVKNKTIPMIRKSLEQKG